MSKDFHKAVQEYHANTISISAIRRIGRRVRSPESYLQLFRDLSANSWMQTPIVDGLHQYAKSLARFESPKLSQTLREYSGKARLVRNIRTAR